MQKAFIIKKESDTWKQYFHFASEEKKFAQLGTDFLLDRIGVIYAMLLPVRQLTCFLTDEEMEMFEPYLLKKSINIEGDIFYTFRKNSPFQKEWEKEVVSKIDFKILSWIHSWYFIATEQLPGHYDGTIWANDKEVVYALIQAPSFKDHEDLQEIPLSRYYAALEREEEKRKKRKGR